MHYIKNRLNRINKKMMVKHMLFLLFIGIVIILVFFMYFRPKYVTLELLEIMRHKEINIKEAKVASDTDWLQIREGVKSSRWREWGVDPEELDIDFDQNNMIISFGREIKEMKYDRAYWFPYHRINTVTTVLSKEFDPHTIYIYKMSKEKIGTNSEMVKTSTFIEE